ncbi:MAG TPA: DUF4040 domain-containing protein [Sediminispirochaeta sp.]|nr:DUF4040 domain-containing protein [Sediminispirochaeta sp.]
MTDFFLEALLFVILLTGTLSLLFRDLFVSVILLAIFSFLSSLLFYVAHAPDVAITEAAVGAGVTTLIFVWAVKASSRATGESGSIRLSLGQIGDLVLVLFLGALLYFILPPLEGGPELMRDFLTHNGYRDTGAFNLVSAIYLGYRAFDTFGETIVLLCAVTGSIYFLSRHG